MKKAFTLIELLVVLVIMVLIMAVVVPQGAKILNRYNKNLQKLKEKQKLIKSKGNSFLTLEEKIYIIENKKFTTTIKGIIIEKSYDNH